MNCPQCKQPVGGDQHNVGPWEVDLGPHGETIGSFRKITICCGFCGVFEVEQDYANKNIRKVGGPYRNAKDVRRLERRIPACRRDRRVPA